MNIQQAIKYLSKEWLFEQPKGNVHTICEESVGKSLKIVMLVTEKDANVIYPTHIDSFPIFIEISPQFVLEGKKEV